MPPVSVELVLLRGGCVCAHGCRLTGKMTGDGAVLMDCASVITLDSTSVITLECLLCGSGSRARNCARKLDISQPGTLQAARNPDTLAPDRHSQSVPCSPTDTLISDKRFLKKGGKDTRPRHASMVSEVELQLVDGDKVRASCLTLFLNNELEEQALVSYCCAAARPHLAPSRQEIGAVHCSDLLRSATLCAAPPSLWYALCCGSLSV